MAAALLNIQTDCVFVFTSQFKESYYNNLVEQMFQIQVDTISIYTIKLAFCIIYGLDTTLLF